MNTEEITFTQSLDGVNWTALKADLAADDFDNGRTPEQLQTSFANLRSENETLEG